MPGKTRVRKWGKEMASVKGRLGADGGALLKGETMVAAKKSVLVGVVLQVRESPSTFGSPYIIDFDTEVLPGVTSFPVNRTNAKKLGELIDDDYSNWHGYGVMIQATRTDEKGRQITNPKTGHNTIGMKVAGVLSPAEVAKKRKGKATIKSKTGDVGAGPVPNWDDLTF